MNTVVPTPSTTISDVWSLIDGMSYEAKLDLVTKIFQSLKQETMRTVSASDFYGIWGDKEINTDLFIEELHSMRSFNRNMVEL